MRSDHQRLLRAAGFDAITELDVTPDFAATAAAWLAETEPHAEELARLEPPGAFEQRQADRRSMLAAIRGRVAAPRPPPRPNKRKGADGEELCDPALMPFTGTRLVIPTRETKLTPVRLWRSCWTVGWVHAAWQGSRCQATWGAGPRTPQLDPAPLEPLGAQADLLLHRLDLGGEAL
jgi:hypothetical protein